MITFPQSPGDGEVDETDPAGLCGYSAVSASDSGRFILRSRLSMVGNTANVNASGRKIFRKTSSERVFRFLLEELPIAVVYLCEPLPFLSDPENNDVQTVQKNRCRLLRNRLDHRVYGKHQLGLRWRRLLCPELRLQDCHDVGERVGAVRKACYAVQTLRDALQRVEDVLQDGGSAG